MTTTGLGSIPCLICGTGLQLRPARGRKSGKAFIMIICPENGRHFRGFITDPHYVGEVMQRLEGRTPAEWGQSELDTSPGPGRRSITNLERGS